MIEYWQNHKGLSRGLFTPRTCVRVVNKPFDIPQQKGKNMNIMSWIWLILKIASVVGLVATLIWVRGRIISIVNSVSSVRVKDETGANCDLNLFKMFWYATMLPGLIGLILLVLGWCFKGIESAPALVGSAIVAAQLGVWICWYFGTYGSPSHWMILIVGGKMIGFRESGRFFCPQLGKLLVEINNEERLKVQGIFGKRGVGLDTEEEVGAALGPIMYSKMTGEESVLGFSPDHPLNQTLTDAFPEVSILFNIINPIMIKKVEVIDRATKCRRRSGVSVAIGQTAEDVKKGYQTGVLGKSISWVPGHLTDVADAIKKVIMVELNNRGLHIEDTTYPTVVDMGETVGMKESIAKIIKSQLDGNAEVELQRKKADASVHEAKTITNMAGARASAEERMATAHQKTLEAEIIPLKASGIPVQRVADILEQKAIRLGYPRLPKDIASLIYGGQAPELWKSLDQESTGGAGPAAKQKPAKTEEKKK